MVVIEWQQQHLQCTRDQAIDPEVHDGRARGRHLRRALRTALPCLLNRANGTRP